MALWVGKEGGRRNDMGNEGPVGFYGDAWATKVCSGKGRRGTKVIVFSWRLKEFGLWIGAFLGGVVDNGQWMMDDGQ